MREVKGEVRLHGYRDAYVNAQTMT